MICWIRLTAANSRLAKVRIRLIHRPITAILWITLDARTGEPPGNSARKTDRPTDPRPHGRTLASSLRISVTDDRPPPTRANHRYLIPILQNPPRTPAHTGEPLPFNPLICGTLPNRRPRYRDQPSPCADLRCAGYAPQYRHALDPRPPESRPGCCCCCSLKISLLDSHIVIIL